MGLTISALCQVAVVFNALIATDSNCIGTTCGCTIQPQSPAVGVLRVLAATDHTGHSGTMCFFCLYSSVHQSAG